mgnify:CR=1 FL=1
MAMALDDQKKMEDCYRRGMRLAEKPGALDNKMGIFHFVGGLLKLESAGWRMPTPRSSGRSVISRIQDPPPTRFLA